MNTNSKEKQAVKGRRSGKSSSRGKEVLTEGGSWEVKGSRQIQQASSSKASSEGGERALREEEVKSAIEVPTKSKGKPPP